MSDERSEQITTTEARAGYTPHVTRYVLGVGLGLLQIAGIAVAVGGVVLAGGPQLRGAPVQRQAILLALIAAAGFGTVFALIYAIYAAP